MVDLPSLVKDEVESVYFGPNNYRTKRISSIFCTDCVQDLPLDMSKIDPKTLQQYTDRISKIQSIKKLLQKELPCFEKDTSFINNECLHAIKNSGLPLISSLPEIKKDLAWSELYENSNKKTRCQIVPVSREGERHERNINAALPIYGNKPNYNRDNKLCKLEVSSTLLKAEPPVVVFRNLNIGASYKKMCKIINISGKKVQFKVSLSSSSQFEVGIRHFKLAAGMSVWVEILFFCLTLAEIHEELVMSLDNGSQLIIPLVVKNEYPQLIEINNDSCNIRDLKIISLIDCGPLLLGDEKSSFITLKNVGAKARFYFLTEIDWHNLELNLEQTVRLKSGSFMIEPVYFSLSKGQSIDIFISFRPMSVGLQAEEVYLLCDNSSINRIDLIGDGITFDPSLIKMSECPRIGIDVKDDCIAECYKDFSIVPIESVVHEQWNFFYNGEINLDCHCEVRPILRFGTKPFPPGSLSCFIDRIESRSLNFVSLQCETLSLTPGRYRSLVVLVVDNLPRKCIPISLKEKILNPSEELDQYSVEVMYLEVWLECTDSTINIEGVLDLSVNSFDEGCKEKKIDIRISRLFDQEENKSLGNYLDFGVVEQGSEHVSQIIAKNKSVIDRLPWKVEEFQFFPNDKLEVTTNLGMLSANMGEFCHRNSEVLIEYRLNTQSEGPRCSVLSWDDQFIPVVADVQRKHVSLSSHLVQVGKVFVGEKHIIKVTLTNHSSLRTAVFWGDHLLESADRVTIEITPRNAVLELLEELVTEISLIAHSKGPLEHLFIPCFVEGQPEPLLLKIKGFVEGVRVRVEWDSGTQCIYWPFIENSDQDSIHESLSLGSVNYRCPPNSETLLSDNVSCSKILNYLSQSASDILETESVHEDDATSEASSIHYMYWPITGGKYTREPMSEEMENHFNNLFPARDSQLSGNGFGTEHTPEQNVLYFHDVPFKKPITKDIYIRNDSKVHSAYKAFLVNNFERPQILDKMSVIETIQCKIKREDTEDEWSKRASKVRGLTVFVDPSMGSLPGEDYVCVRITVYAITWGCYSDTLILEIDDLDQLCVKVKVTVNCPPISVPPLLRFGGASFNDPQQVGKFRVENSSSVPLRLSWHVFKESEQTFPFGLMLLDGEPFTLHLTPHYGSHFSPHFQVVDRYTFVPPSSSTTVKVNFTPLKSDGNLFDGTLSSTLRATLIGHVYLTDEAMNLTEVENCVRNDGSKLDPLRVNLEGYVELPVLSLLNVYESELIFRCTAYDISVSTNHVWEKKKVITVQNKSRAKLKARISTVGYFYLSKLTYPCPSEKKEDAQDHICLEPGEVCEVEIKCEMTYHTFNDCMEEECDDEVVEWGFVAFEQECARQIVQLQLRLYRPLINVSATSINFGLVYTEDTKIMTVTLTASVNKEYIETHVTNSAFSVDTQSACLAPQELLHLQVSFSPKYCISYKGVLVIETYLDNAYWKIPLEGCGTFDYKSHVY